jgi:hypothetical protein
MHKTMIQNGLLIQSNMTIILNQKCHGYCNRPTGLHPYFIHAFHTSPSQRILLVILDDESNKIIFHHFQDHQHTSWQLRNVSIQRVKCAT